MTAVALGSGAAVRHATVPLDPPRSGAHQFRHLERGRMARAPSLANSLADGCRNWPRLSPCQRSRSPAPPSDGRDGATGSWANRRRRRTCRGECPGPGLSPGCKRRCCSTGQRSPAAWWRAGWRCPVGPSRSCWTAVRQPQADSVPCGRGTYLMPAPIPGCSGPPHSVRQPSGLAGARPPGLRTSSGRPAMAARAIASSGPGRWPVYRQSLLHFKPALDDARSGRS